MLINVKFNDFCNENFLFQLILDTLLDVSETEDRKEPVFDLVFTVIAVTDSTDHARWDSIDFINKIGVFAIVLESHRFLEIRWRDTLDWERREVLL